MDFESIYVINFLKILLIKKEKNSPFLLQEIFFSIEFSHIVVKVFDVVHFFLYVIHSIYCIFFIFTYIYIFSFDQVKQIFYEIRIYYFGILYFFNRLLTQQE